MNYTATARACRDNCPHLPGESAVLFSMRVVGDPRPAIRNKTSDQYHVKIVDARNRWVGSTTPHISLLQARIVEPGHDATRVRATRTHQERRRHYTQETSEAGGYAGEIDAHKTYDEGNDRRAHSLATSRGLDCVIVVQGRLAH